MKRYLFSLLLLPGVAFAQAGVCPYKAAPIGSKYGYPCVQTESSGTVNDEAASMAAVATAVANGTAGLAPLASPAFTGTPGAPTPASTVLTNQLATAASVQAALPFVPAVFYGVNKSNSAATNDTDIAAACTAIGGKGATLWFPQGAIQTAAGITCPATNGSMFYAGLGMGVTTIQQITPGGADGFLLSKSGQSFGGVYNMSITQCASATVCAPVSPSKVLSPEPTTGCGVDLQNGSNIVLVNLAIKQFWNSACEINVGYVTAVNVFSSNDYNDGFYTNGQVFGLYVNTTTNHSDANNDNASYEFQYSQGFRLTSCSGSGSNFGLEIDTQPIAGTSPQEYTSVGTWDVDNCNFDSSNSVGLELNTNAGGFIFQGHVVNSGFSFAGTVGGPENPNGIGVQTQGPAGTIQNTSLLDVNVNRSLLQAVQLLSGANVFQIADSQFGANNQSITSNTCAIEVDNVSHVTIAHNYIGGYLNSAFVGPPTYPGSPVWESTQQCGLYFTSSFAGKAFVTANDFDANIGFDYNNVSSGSVQLIGDVGVIANGSKLPCVIGQSTIPVGNSSVAVTFKSGSNSTNNLSATPSRIALSASAPTAVGFGTATASGMTLSTASNVTGSNLTIDWLAGVDGKSSCFN